ncbi:MAG TPA: FtsX-like permease family protein [Gemmatimonadales bacterium]|nr:FtsX-like permease family protein [Gemmatimonadales bacterium]
MTALRNLLRHPIRSGLALAGIAITTAMLLDMVLLAGGIERSFERMLMVRGFQIRISPKGTLPFDTEATIPGVTSLLQAIRSDSAVDRAGPMVGASVYSRRGDTLITLFGYGIEAGAQGVYQVEEGTDLTPDDRDGLLISAPAAAQLGARIGDTVTLVGRLDPQAAAGAIEHRLVVRARVKWLYDYRGQASVGTSLPVMQDLVRLRTEDRVSAVLVRVKRESEVEQVTRDLRARFPMLEVNSVADMVVHFRQRLVYFRQLSYILGSISLVVTVLLVSTLMTITVNERLGEIATLRAIGISRWSILKGVMLEGATLTIAGGLLGSALGTVTAKFLDRILTSFPGLPAAISFFVPYTQSLVLAAIVLVITGVAAGVYPALLAARAPIAATLRTEAT